MDKQILKIEIEKRLNNEIWERQITKKIIYKLYIYKIKKNIKIAIVLLLISLSWISIIEYENYKREEKFEILSNLYYDYHYPQFNQFVNFYDE
jgi:hypothetical protein